MTKHLPTDICVAAMQRNIDDARAQFAAERDRGYVNCSLCDKPATLHCQWEVGRDKAGQKLDGWKVCRNPFCKQHAGELWEALSPFGKESFAVDEIAQ